MNHVLEQDILINFHNKEASQFNKSLKGLIWTKIQITLILCIYLLNNTATLLMPIRIMNVDNILPNQLYKNILQMLTYLSDTAQLKLLNH